MQSNLDQLSQLTDATICKAKDGKLRLSAVSQSAHLMAIIETGCRLNRSVQYLSDMASSSETTLFSPYKNNCYILPDFFGRDKLFLLLGTRSGLVEIYHNPTLSKYVKCGEIQVDLDPRLDLTRLKWINNDHFITISGSLEMARVSLWTANSFTMIRQWDIDRYVSEFKDIQIFNDCLVWIENDKLRSNSNNISFDEPIIALFSLSSQFILAVPPGKVWHMLDTSTESWRTIEIPGSSSFLKGFSKLFHLHTRIFFLDEEGWQWIACFDAQHQYEFIRFKSGHHDSQVQDVHICDAVLVILRDSMISVHDIISTRLLILQQIQSNKRHNTDDREFKKRILQVNESDGLLLFQWGPSTVQLWNYGSKMDALNPLPRIQKQSQKKNLVYHQMKSEYEDWREGKMEAEALDKLRDRHNPEGMTEEEMIALALSLSTANLKCRTSSPMSELSPEDEELRMILELSKHVK